MAVNVAKLPELPRREGRTTKDVSSAQLDEVKPGVRAVLDD